MPFVGHVHAGAIACGPIEHPLPEIHNQNQVQYAGISNDFVCDILALVRSY